MMVTAAARNPLVLFVCEAYDRARTRRCQHHSYHGAHSHSLHPLPVAEYPRLSLGQRQHRNLPPPATLLPTAGQAWAGW